MIYKEECGLLHGTHQKKKYHWMFISHSNLIIILKYSLNIRDNSGDTICLYTLSPPESSRDLTSFSCVNSSLAKVCCLAGNFVLSDFWISAVFNTIFNENFDDFGSFVAILWHLEAEFDLKLLSYCSKCYRKLNVQ